MSETIISIGESVTAHLFNYVLLSGSYINCFYWLIIKFTYLFAKIGKKSDFSK